MKKRIFHILIISAFIGTVYYLAGGLNGLLHPTTVRAFGDLTVNFHVPLGKPIFNLTNLAPGNPIPVKPVDVSNTGALARYVAVRGIRTGGTVEVPGIESAMTIPTLASILSMIGNSKGMTRYSILILISLFC